MTPSQAVLGQMPLSVYSATLLFTELKMTGEWQYYLKIQFQ